MHPRSLLIHCVACGVVECEAAEKGGGGGGLLIEILYRVSMGIVNFVGREGERQRG